VSFVLHGALVGVVSLLIQVGLDLSLNQHESLRHIVTQALSIPFGAAGGLVAGRRRSLFGSGEEEPRVIVTPYKKALSFACGILVGGFLFCRFGFDNHGHLFGWQWYQGAVLLGGIGLAGIFSEAWQSAAVGLSIAPTLVFCYEVVYLHPAESMWPVVLPLVLLFSWPVPLIGGSIGKLLGRTQVPRAVYFVALTSALVIGALFLPNIQNALR